MAIRFETAPDFSRESAALAEGFTLVCGVDESGRGPLAGPVVAAAVIFDPANIPAGLNDSKKLTETARENLFARILATAEVGVGVADVERIDRDNILAATLWAMGEALTQLGDVSFALVDGNRAPRLACGVRTVIGDDAKSLSIAAASIVAKVTRDRLMTALHLDFPQYGFARHKGYGVREHLEALRQYGPCPVHRRSFQPVAQTQLPLEAAS